MLTVYALNQSIEWDSVVRSFNNYDVYWLSGYVKAFQIHGEGDPLLFYFQNNETRGINVVMKRDVALDSHFIGNLNPKTYFDFSSPYGYGGWLIEGKETAQLFIEYEQWCRENGIVSEFIRFHSVLENHIEVAEYYDIVTLGNTVALDLASPEVIWANLTSKNRNVIRKAKKNNIKIYHGHYPEIYEIFRKIYNTTMDKDNADEYYYFGSDFYKSILEDLPQNAQVFYAEYSGKIIAASIILMSNGRMNYHLSGSLKEYSSVAATNLLLYEAARWGCANGYKTFYLGGGVGSKEDSLYKFKKAFYRYENLKKFHIGKKIFNQEIYDELVNMREIITDNRYFPKYRTNSNI